MAADAGRLRLDERESKDPRFKIARTKGTPAESDALLADLRRVAADLGRGSVPQKVYAEHGTYDYSTVIRRFGSWNQALIAAGLTVNNVVNVADETLFENILALWSHLGRQPARADLSRSTSTISQSTYNRRFGSWTGALHAFAECANLDDSPI